MRNLNNTQKKTGALAISSMTFGANNSSHPHPNSEQDTPTMTTSRRKHDIRGAKMRLI